MKKMDPQKILDGVLKEAHKDEHKGLVGIITTKLTYKRLNQLIYIKSYTMLMQDVKAAMNAVEKELDLLGETFIKIMNITDQPLIEAANEYFENLGVVFPKFQEIINTFDEPTPEEFMKILGKIKEHDPWQNWKSTVKSGRERQELFKLMAAVGKLMIIDELTDQGFYSYVTEHMEMTRYPMASDLYISYHIQQAFTNQVNGKNKKDG